MFILERTCLQFEPDDPLFVRITHRVYEEINEKSHFDLIKSTRFYGPMVFHLTIKKCIDNLLLHYLTSGQLELSKELVELFNIVHGTGSRHNTLSESEVIESYIHSQSKSHKLLTTLKAIQERLTEKNSNEALSADSSN